MLTLRHLQYVGFFFLSCVYFTHSIFEGFFSMNVYVSVCILLCFYRKSVNKRWKRIRNHLEVIVSFYKKCIIRYKNHNAHNRVKDKLNKGRLELWKKLLSIYLIRQKIWDKSKELFQSGGKLYPTNLSQILSIHKPFLDKNDKINLVKVQKLV